MKSSLSILLACVLAAVSVIAESSPPMDEARYDALAGELDQTTGLDHKLACSNLYVFIQQTIAAAENTPGREAANFLQTGALSNLVAALEIGRVSNTASLTHVRSQVLLALKGPTWPKPPAIDVPYATHPPVIDGRLDDPGVDRTAAVFTNSYEFNETNAAPRQTTYRLLWDEHYLYFAFDCEDEDIVAPVEPRDAPIYHDDCVEMFILPEPRFRTYWELDISPSKCIFDSLQHKRLHEWGAVMEPSANIDGLKIGVALRGTLNDSHDRDQGYSMEVAVPFDQLPGYTHGPPAAGQTLSLMLARLDRNNTLAVDANGHETTNSTFKAYSFIPLLSWGHNIWNHSIITLRK